MSYKKLLLGLLVVTWVCQSNSALQVYQGEGCDKLKYIEIDYSCPAEGLFAIAQNCIDFIHCVQSPVTSALHEVPLYEDLFQSCGENESFGGEAGCVKVKPGAAANGKGEIVDCVQMQCHIVDSQTKTDATETLTKTNQGTSNEINDNLLFLIVAIVLTISLSCFTN